MAKESTTTLKPAAPRWSAMDPARRAAPALALLLAAAALAGCLAPASPRPPPGEPERPASADAPPPVGAASDQPPHADFDVLPAMPAAGQIVRFLDRSTDPDDGIGGRVWDFGDHVQSRFDNATHVYAAPGVYTVVLVVSDHAGKTDNATRVLRVLDPAQAPVPSGPKPHVVVALIDTGVNPYHEVFRDGASADPAGYLPGYPADARALPLTLGKDYAADVKADGAAWGSIEPRKLYWIPGTRIAGAITFGNDTFGNAKPNKQPILDDDGHGTATASTAARNSPHAELVIVECGAQSLQDAMVWAANQTWIDVVSVSIGPLLDLPAPDFPLDALTGATLASRASWEHGQLFFAAAGNEPTLSATSPVSGPAWVIAVGGALPASSTDPGTAAKAMDLVSDYSPQVAQSDSTDGWKPDSGTSFSTPSAAGAAAEALFLVRAQAGYLGGLHAGKLIDAGGPGLVAGGLTNGELRDALNATARYWNATDAGLDAGLPILPAPWVQMGWGYLDGRDAPAIAQAVLGGKLPAKDPLAAAYMGAVQQARVAMWG